MTTIGYGDHPTGATGAGSFYPRKKEMNVKISGKTLTFREITCD